MNKIKQGLFLLAFTGWMISFNSSAADCSSGIKIPAGTYKPVIPGVIGSDKPFSINISGCEYKPVNDNYIAYTEGPLKDGIYSSDGYISTGVKFSPGVSESFPFNPDEHDNPDTIPPVTPPVKPPEPDKPAPPSGSYLSQVLSDISHLTPGMLYSSFYFHYDFSSSLEDNKRVAQAFLQKLSNVTPPDYAAVDRIKSMMDDWQKTYSYLRPSDAGPYLLWNSSKFVSGEHRYTGSIIIAVYNCAKPNIYGDCYDVINPLDINDPNYASLNDYKNGITRCMRNPDDPSCHSSGDSSGDAGDSSGDHTVTTCSPGYHPDASRPGVCVSDNPGGGTGSDGGDQPDTCPPGSHHVPGSPDGSCTTDLNPNPGGGGGSGSGNTDNNDNGDVVAAINAFHADNNKNHKELMDDLNKKPADPDYTGMEGEFSSLVGGAMSGITDSVKSAWDAGKAAFGEGLSGIDSMLPDIKTSFDLPPGFEAASTGRCIPVVLDFDIKLVGIPDYHFHAVGTQVCLLYDKYIRPVLNFVLVILSFFVIHRLLVRSAEFLTDGRH
ncbi:TPA: hypothetical protein G9F11_002846 [Salmonella enterica]|uniref:Uncharacterized protein n=1 Tax=Salmonella enterica TaxID=28901 RepID=A0A750HM19_SALER|nr:hypothetical protein [Salmonella enterica]